MWWRYSNIRGFLTSHVRCSKTVKESVDKNVKEGMEMEGFLVNQVISVPDFHMTMVRLKHVKTGCDYMHLARDDQHNAFAITFRTTPKDSTGVAHILEHTVLCGSQKYPCRNPLLKMLNRSMATLMNAFTGPDYTMYPFATQNRTDFKNLMSVFMDAVFRPNLRELDFRQEGWRLEHEKTNDKNSPIVFKGVVLNEMKGAFSENQDIFEEAILNNILPSHTYGVLSGGDPKVIPTLTYNDLKAFHKKYYHPSNCKIYSYGNFPLQETLHFVNKNYLADWPDVQDIGKLTIVPPEPRWNAEKKKSIHCKPDPLASNPKKQSSIAISTLCNDVRLPQETFDMDVLSELLLNEPNSAFYKALVEPNIGGGFSSGTGYDTDNRDTIFSVGLSSVDQNDFDKIVDIYHKTIDKVINEGFDENNIKAILHSTEMNMKHQASNFGLDILSELIHVWNHDGDVAQMLKVNDKIMKLKKNMSDNPAYFQDLVQKIKDNPHRLILTMSPDEDFEKKEALAEKELLTQKLGNLTDEQKDDIYNQGLELAKDQELEQDVNVLPALTTSDLNVDVERVKLKTFTVQEVPTQFCVVPTNGVTYFRGVINTSTLSEEEKNVLPLFCSILTQMGTKTHDYKKMMQHIELNTGGVSFSCHIAENISDTGSYEEGVNFSSHCLDKDLKVMFDIFSELFNSVNLQDQKRFETLVKNTANNLIQGIPGVIHFYALSTADALISPSAFRKEQYVGLTFVQTIKQLSQKTNYSDSLDMMKRIADVVMKKKLIRLAVNTSLESEEKIRPSLESFLKSVPGEFKQSSEMSKPDNFKKGIFAIHQLFPFSVSAAAYCIPTVAYTHPDFPVLKVLAKLLTSKYLFVKIREKGGAYGAEAKITNSGSFSFFSSRDPKPYDTFDTFNASKEWVAAGNFTDQDVEEAKLGLFRSMDAPVSPGSKGVRYFHLGISDDELQRFRKVLIRVTKDDIIRSASYLDSSVEGRALLGPLNDAVLARQKENWTKRVTE